MTKFRFRKKDMVRWIQALRSGKYAQTTGSLQRKDGFCCLGVACDLFIPPKRQKREIYLIGDMPDEQRHAPKWLRRINEDFESRFGVGLADLNDGFAHLPYTDADGNQRQEAQKFSFDEIADILQSVYLLKVIPEPKKAVEEEVA